MASGAVEEAAGTRTSLATCRHACGYGAGTGDSSAGSGVARVIARTNGNAIPAAHDTTTSAAAVSSTASVPQASDAGPASAWPAGVNPSAISQTNESTRLSRWLGTSCCRTVSNWLLPNATPAWNTL